jgi:osmoprotectant transport system substrate-binding protein
MRMDRLLVGGVALAMLGPLSTSAAASASTKPKPKPKPKIIIGSTDFEEQAIVANLYGGALTHAGYPVEIEPAAGSRSTEVPAIEQGQIDLEPDYAGSLVEFLNNGMATTVADNLTTAIPSLKKSLKPYGVTVLKPAPALDTDVIVVTKATAKKDHLTTISNLKPYASKFILGGPPECPTDPSCQPGLEKTYGLKFASFKPTDELGPLAVADLKGGGAQVVELFSSDDNVVSNHFVALTDNKHLGLADYVTPVIRTSVATKAVTKVLDQVSAKLTATQLSKLNLLVTGPKKEQPATVAAKWLRAEGLVQDSVGGSVGYPADFHATNPPSKSVVCGRPRLTRLAAARLEA